VKAWPIDPLACRDLTLEVSEKLPFVAALVVVKATASPPILLMARDEVRLHHRIAGTSLEPSLPTWHGNIAKGRGNDLGYGENVEDWVIRSQAPKGVICLWRRFND